MSKKSSKRIVRIIAKLNISGPAMQAILLTAELQKLDYECFLIAHIEPESNDSLAKLAEDYHIQTIDMPEFAYSNIWGAIRAFWRLVQLLKELHPDIVHTHNPRAGFLSRIAARVAGVPVVVHTLHEYPFRGYYTRFRTLIFVLMERIGAYFSDSIITLSQSLRKALVETYKITHKSRITVLPLGYDLQAFADTKRHDGRFRSQWGIPDDAPLIGIIGRLLPVKNHRLFLEMAAQIHDKIPKAYFVIVGDGTERAALVAYTQQLGMSDWVIFTGWQQAMESIYSDLDVLVNTSLNEGTPVPIIEALTAQCPVVASDVGGIADLLNNGELGMLVPANDCDALVQAIQATLHNTPDMAIAQATMLRRYSIQRLAQDLDSLYRGLLARKQAHKST